jgi:hypothetical protein
VYGVLFVAGFGYNALVSYLERRGYDDGFTAPLVVVGVLFTIGGVALVDWRAALLTLGAFAASGFWMVIGSWWRHVTARRHSQEALRSEALLPERESGEE